MDGISSLRVTEIKRAGIEICDFSKGDERGVDNL
jgi:hypothetical protein